MLPFWYRTEFSQNFDWFVEIVTICCILIQVLGVSWPDAFLFFRPTRNSRLKIGQLFSYPYFKNSGPKIKASSKISGKTWRNISCCLHYSEISNQLFTRWFKFNKFISKILSTPLPQSSFKGHKNVQEHRPHHHHRKRRKDHTELMIYSITVIRRRPAHLHRHRKKVRTFFRFIFLR